jgi:hypothetical protein
MYCVKCGVKLQDGVECCPLCDTPVWNPDLQKKRDIYPDIYPAEHQSSRRPIAVFITALSAMAIVVILTVCFRLYGELRWGSYAIGGIVLFCILTALPCWFRKPLAEVFIAVDHVAILAYMLFVSILTGGGWFLSFAFPVIMIHCALITALVCLMKYVKGHRIMILGGYFIAMGGFTILIEFFEHITFGTPMWLWSLYSVAALGAVGVFLLLAGIIPPMKHFLEKRFFF